jgi:hypothetical protein
VKPLGIHDRARGWSKRDRLSEVAWTFLFFFRGKFSGDVPTRTDAAITRLKTKTSSRAARSTPASTNLGRTSIYMKSLRLFTLTLCAAVIAIPTLSFAAKPGKGNKPGKIVRQYDANADGSIDGSEIEAFRKAFETDKTGPLKQFDTDSNGTLSDTEISAIKVHAKKKKKNA